MSDRLKLLMAQKRAASIGLTEVQFRLLSRLAAGKTVNQIEKEAGYSYGSYQGVLRRARVNIGASTTAHAINILWQNGVLTKDFPYQTEKGTTR